MNLYEQFGERVAEAAEFIRDNGPIAPRAVAERLGIPRGSIDRVINKLVDHGLVLKERPNGRSVVLHWNADAPPIAKGDDESDEIAFIQNGLVINAPNDLGIEVVETETETENDSEGPTPRSPPTQTTALPWVESRESAIEGLIALGRLQAQLDEYRKTCEAFLS